MAIRDKLGFILSLVGILGLITMHLKSGLDVQMAVLGIVAAFTGTRAYQNTKIIQAASADPMADTGEAIDKVTGSN